MITLTDDAVEQLKKFAEEEGIGHLNIRVKILGGGCGGLQFDMIFDDLPNTEMDEVIKQDDITIIVDCLSLTYMRGEIILEYIKTEFGSGFKFILPDDELRSCGCGSSFSAI